MRVKATKLTPAEFAEELVYLDRERPHRFPEFLYGMVEEGRLSPQRKGNYAVICDYAYLNPFHGLCWFWFATEEDAEAYRKARYAKARYSTWVHRF